jgi:hypothetical protein
LYRQFVTYKYFLFNKVVFTIKKQTEHHGFINAVTYYLHYLKTVYQCNEKSLKKSFTVCIVIIVSL